MTAAATCTATWYSAKGTMTNCIKPFGHDEKDAHLDKGGRTWGIPGRPHGERTSLSLEIEDYGMMGGTGEREL
jgi:hypothetical protein